MEISGQLINKVEIIPDLASSQYLLALSSGLHNRIERNAMQWHRMLGGSAEGNNLRLAAGFSGQQAAEID
jgi:hypothetical protein